MRRIKQWAVDKSHDLQDRLSIQARAKYLAQVMEWEDVDYEEAVAICSGETVPVEWEYTLGYKMCDPIYLMAMNCQMSRKKRQRAIDHFATLLEPEEIEIFNRDVLNGGFRKHFVAALRKKS